jgi:transketolase C-terminal domain/subunit
MAGYRSKVATRLAYGNGIVSLGLNNQQVVALDAEVKNSTYSIKFKVKQLLTDDWGFFKIPAAL